MVDSISSNNSGFENKSGSNQNGLAEVRNGEIIITNPVGGGQKARIKPDKGLKILVNGAEISTATAVSKESVIKVILPNKKVDRKFDINIKEDAMSVSALASYIDGEEYKLMDAAPVNELTIKTELVKREECPCFTSDEVKELLRMRGVVYGILADKVAEAAAKGNIDHCIIAEGKRPVDGIDDTIDCKFDDEKKFSIINDRVDFYSIGKVTSTDEGNLLAEKIAGNDGEDGTDIYGNKIRAKPGKKLNMVAGKGVDLSPDGSKAYSKIQGRPELKGNIISVYEVYEVPSDVDISTGNIEFKGDVIIKGDVTDGMKVKAGNTLFVAGIATNSFLSAGSDIKINKNVIGTEIMAGSNDFVKYNLIEALKVIEKGLSSLYTAAVALKDTGKIPKTYKDGQIIKLLMDTKFNDMEKHIIGLRSSLYENREYIGSDMINLGAKLIKFFLGNGPLLIESQGDLTDFKDWIVDQIEVLKSQLKKPSNISVKYVQNSKLYTSGDVVIEGKGCYNSEIICRGSVTIDKPGSVMRGGSISAVQDVNIYELGSPSGAHTLVSTEKDAVIYCKIAHANSVLRIGEMSNKIETSIKNVKAYQYKGELMVESLKL